MCTPMELTLLLLLLEH
uniref:Uncharacterized protein n=1 Tax=Arundo donax TaxID=35708 RepID=A0A0A9EWB9_ARUDO